MCPGSGALWDYFFLLDPNVILPPTPMTRSFGASGAAHGSGSGGGGGPPPTMTPPEGMFVLKEGRGGVGALRSGLVGWAAGFSGIMSAARARLMAMSRACLQGTSRDAQVHSH